MYLSTILLLDYLIDRLGLTHKISLVRFMCLLVRAPLTFSSRDLDKGFFQILETEKVQVTLIWLENGFFERSQVEELHFKDQFLFHVPAIEIVVSVQTV